MDKVIVHGGDKAKELREEARELRQTAKRIAASKQEAQRFLVATGMYTATGELKPQFR